MTESLAYDDASQLISDSYSGGPLDGLVVTNDYDAFLRRTAVAVSNQPTTLVQYGYDSAGCLSGVTNSVCTATYSYLANSPLVGQITYAKNGNVQMTKTNSYDYVNRLKSVATTPGTNRPISFTYTYNNANQRVRVDLADGSYWRYEYDSLGQVTSGKKYWSDGTPVAGQQFEYGFDDIGNRTSTESGGDQNGGFLRSASYYANTLNQYTSRDVPGYVQVLGVALATNPVTVNTLGTYRKGEYFQKELSADNSSDPVWESISVEAAGETTVNGHAFVPETPEQFGYDADGNLTNDGRFSYSWDGENRLTNMTSLSSAPAGSEMKLDFVYDAQGRRIEKIVSTNNGSAYVPQSTNVFVYDGWNLLAELGPGDSLIRSYVWGTDLSGTPQGAGGVGGLLMMYDSGIRYFYAYDGNGNVAALAQAANGTVWANYEYGPFGEVIRATGPMARVNPFRFSTKYQDNESDLVYYGYRYYNPSAGRWLSRDASQEMGGVNLYAFIKNCPGDFIDLDGLACEPTGFQFADSAHWILTKLHPNKDSGADFGLLVSSFDLTWEAKVTVLCCCDRKPGTRVSHANVGDGPWIFFDVTQWPMEVPIATSIENGIGKIMAGALKHLLGKILPGYPADRQEARLLVGKILTTRPGSPCDGDWADGKSPCR